MARFLVDESLPPLLAEELRNAGHEAEHVASLGLAGAPDEDVYARADAMSAILISRDLDFADRRRFTGEAGVVVVRLRTRIRLEALVNTIVHLLTDAMAQLEDLSGTIVILEPGRTRVRRR